MSKDGFYNRRWMARIAFACGALVYPVLIYTAAEKAAEQLIQVAIPYYAFLTVVVTAYYKYATDENNKERELANAQ